MLLDLNAYIGHWPFRPLQGGTARSLIESMDRYGIDQAAVGSIQGLFYINPQDANEELHAAITPYRQRLIPFAVLNPTYPDWRHDLDVCVRQMGMKGLRLYPQYHDYEINDPRCFAIVQAAVEYNIPVAFTLRIAGGGQLWNRSWLDVPRELSLDEVAAVVRAVPRARYIVLHADGVARFETPETATLLKDADLVFDTLWARSTLQTGGGAAPQFAPRIVNPNGLTGSTGPASYDLPSAIDFYGLSKFAFGSSAPFRNQVNAMLRVELLQGQTDKEALWSGNARRILNLA